MRSADLPVAAAWRHGNSRTGLEATTFARTGPGWQIVGSTTAIEDGRSWWVGYDIALTAGFVTRRALVECRTGVTSRVSVDIESDGEGHWRVDGRPQRHLDGCLDVDLESSAMTNALPMRRVSPLGQNETVQVPAVYVRVGALSVERLEQSYTRVSDPDEGYAFDYQAPIFDFACRIHYDQSGLVTSYPGIADRLF